MLGTRTVPSLILFIMGYMDWLTTIIGIFYFGAVEVNPLFTDITKTNLAEFTIIKLAITTFVVLLYYLGERMLTRLKDTKGQSFMCARLILRIGYLVITVILLSAILNNIIVIGKII